MVDGMRYEDYDLWDEAELGIDDIMVDDDNLPAPENDGTTNDDSLEESQKWSIATTDARRIHGYPHPNAALKNVSKEIVTNMTVLQVFTHMFPMEYIRQTVVPKTSQRLTVPLSVSEFISWLGVWLLMSCYVGVKHQDW